MCHSRTLRNFGILLFFCAVVCPALFVSRVCDAQTASVYYASGCSGASGNSGTICLDASGPSPSAAADPVASGIDNFMVSTYDSPNGNGTSATTYYQVTGSSFQGCNAQGSSSGGAVVGGNVCNFAWTASPTAKCYSYLANQCVPDTPNYLGDSVLVSVTTTAPSGYNPSCGVADTGYQYAMVPGSSGQPPPSVLDSTSPSSTGCAMAVYGCIWEQAIGSLPGTWLCAEQFTGSNFDPNGTSAPSVSSSPASGNCVTFSGVQSCISSDSTGCGTFNGNQVCPQAIQPGSCVSYSSGGIACGVAAPGDAPPASAPTASGGAAASPTGIVTDTANARCSSGCSSTTSYYYSHSVVSSSSSAVQSVSTSPGAPSSIGALPSSSSSSSGSSSGAGGGGLGGCSGTSASPCVTSPLPNAANGDCAAMGLDCSLAGNPLPSTSGWSSDSWSGAYAAFLASVDASPIATSVSAIENAWPSGASCPALMVDITTLHQSFDYGSEICSLWSSAAVPVLSATMLAFWSLCGVVIFLSA